VREGSRNESSSSAVQLPTPLRIRHLRALALSLFVPVTFGFGGLKRLQRQGMSGGGFFQPPDGLGVHSMQRYRHFRRFVEAQVGEQLDQTMFGLLLSAESMRDEMRAYQDQPSRLLLLAQTGHCVRQLQRLNGILDEASALYDVEESEELQDWKGAMESEREARMELYDRALAMMEHKGGCHLALDETPESFFGEFENEEQQ
jgi:hypothetical protein